MSEPLTTRQLAFNLLKTTRNPEYVALRYGYPIEKMRAALEQIPYEEPLFRTLEKRASSHHPTRARRENLKRASELLPETLGRSRVPGEDDDLGEEPETALSDVQ